MAEIIEGRDYSVDEAAYLLALTPDEVRQCLLARGHKDLIAASGALSAAQVEEVWRVLKPYAIVGIPSRGRVKVEDEAALRQLWRLHGALAAPTAVQFRFSTEEEAQAAVPQMPYYPGYTWSYVRAEPDRPVWEAYDAAATKQQPAAM